MVEYGLQHRHLENIRSIGVDEILYRAGYKFLTLVYQIDSYCRRLLYVGEDREVKTLLRFFQHFGRGRSQWLKAVCCDMWKPYPKVIAKKAINAVIILDRFHIMKHFNEAIDTMWRQEARQLAKDGHEEILKHARWCLLKNQKNETTSHCENPTPVFSLKRMPQSKTASSACRKFSSRCSASSRWRSRTAPARRCNARWLRSSSAAP